MRNLIWHHTQSQHVQNIMFEYISGKISELTPTYVVLDCNQIGYFIHISLNTYATLENKDSAKLYVYEAIREDAYTLYGFSEKDERQLFLLLISVSGIGANTARMILSSFSVNELKTVIATDDVNQMKGVKGIGLKTAQRVIIDLKDKVDVSDADLTAKDAVGQTKANKEESVAALVMLGFARPAAVKVVDKILEENPAMQLEKVLKEALKRM